MITILAYITLLFYTVRFLVALINRIWSPRLRRGKISTHPMVSVLIPARNEERNIARLLGDLRDQDYHNIEVLVFNDRSTDRTLEVARQFMAADSRFGVIDSEGLPPGWLGKSYGCHRLGEKAHGNYLLFLDADVRVGPGLIESALAHLKRHQLQLLSLFPKQEMVRWGERMVVPLMNFILLTLLPMRLTRISRRTSLSAANGQFMLFVGEAYRQVQPHERVKYIRVEDIAIARLFKSLGLRMECMTGNSDIRCRMYHNLPEALYGMSRSVAAFFGGSHAVALIYWLLSFLGPLAVLMALPPVYLLMLFVLIVAIHGLVASVSLHSFLQQLLLAPARQFFLGVTIFLSYIHQHKRRTVWKDRILE